MLTKENSRGFIPHISYPVYEYLSKKGNRMQAKYDGGRITPKPKRYTEIIRYHNEDEDFETYLKWITEDHKDISDQRMKESPYGIFIGTWRNARWFDEAQRRGLVELVS